MVDDAYTELLASSTTKSIGEMGSDELELGCEILT